jgi:L-lactate dehydrogenase (cytochrome)
MLGKAWAFALAAGGETGVERMLTLMRQELTTAMVLSGTSDMSSGSL